MTLLAGYITPHPPLIVPGIGGEEREQVGATIAAMKEVADRIATHGPETIVVITPHGPVFSDAMLVNTEENLGGDFGAFGAADIAMRCPNDLDFADALIDHAKFEGLPLVSLDASFAERFDVSEKLDHGVLVPLHFIRERSEDFRLVHITYGLLSPLELYRVGRLIEEVAEELGRPYVVVASGDLSHRLKDAYSYDYHPSGPAFDKALMKALEDGAVDEIIHMDRSFIREAGECGKRSVDTLLGVFDAYDFTTEVLSYEGPFGVGYGVVALEAPKKNGLSRYPALLDEAERLRTLRRAGYDAHVSLATEAVAAWVKGGDVETLRHRPYARELLNEKAGCFVTIHGPGGLRGCIGTILATEETLFDEIIKNARSAALNDPRFPALAEGELDQLEISVDVLSEPEAVPDRHLLDPKVYGVILTAGDRRGLLLPDLEGIDTVEEQLRIARQKAGIDEEEAYEIERFTVERHGG